MDKTILKTVLTGRNILLVGPGGVGKSYTLRFLAKNLSDIYQKKVYVCCSTGIAAVNLSEGSPNFRVTTLHRFAGCKTGIMEIDSLIYMIKNSRAAKNWKKCEILIIDEISMIGCDLFKKLDAVSKSIRKNNNPFGGIQLILSGDFLQLCPVKDSWIFLAREWTDLNLRPFILETPYRYDDTNFFDMLLRIRIGEMTEQDYKILRGRVQAHNKMQEILTKVTTNNNISEIIKPTIFYSRKIDVDAYNQRELKKLSGELIKFTAVDAFMSKKENVCLEDYKKILDEDMPPVLQFKIGAQVMLRVNLDINAGLVNGSRGVVNDIIDNQSLLVKFLNGQKVKIDLHARKFEDKKAVIVRTQIPCILAYSMTIHRAQGSTLDYAIVDLGPSIFCPGQAYVALGRVRNINGLFISNFASQSIMADKQAIQYSKEIKEICKKEDLKETQFYIGALLVLYKANKFSDPHRICYICKLENNTQYFIPNTDFVGICEGCYNLSIIHAQTILNIYVIKYMYIMNYFAIEGYQYTDIVYKILSLFKFIDYAEIEKQ